MKTLSSPQLTRAINQQAHRLARQSFASYRATLAEMARTMLADGMCLEDTMKYIRTIQLHHKATES